MSDLAEVEVPVDTGIESARARVLPEPRGYKMLIMLPTIAAVSEGGIIIPEQTRDEEKTASVTGFVLKMGDMAYSDPNKFPTGAWCDQGDWVMFRAYSGTRFKVSGTEFRLINDDMVEAVVQDPRGVTRA